MFIHFIHLESSPSTHALPRRVIIDKNSPGTADAACSRERLSVLYIAEDIKCNFWREISQEVALEACWKDRREMHELCRREVRECRHEQRVNGCTREIAQMGRS